MKFPSVIIVLVFIYLSNAYATIDSLNNLISKSKADTNKVNLLNQVSFKYAFANPELGERKASEALELAKKLNFKFGEARAYNNLAINIGILGNSEKAIEYLNKLIYIASENDFKLLLCYGYGNLANIYTANGDSEKALNYFELQLKYAKELNNPEQISSAIGNTGNIYNDFGDFPKALEYYYKALDIYQSNNIKGGEALMYGNIGNVYSALNDYKKALEHYDLACKIDMELGNMIGVARHYNNMGMNFELEKNHQIAIEYFNKAMDIYIEFKYKEGEAIASINLAGSYASLEKFNDAISYFNKAIAISNETNDLNNLVITYGDLGITYLLMAKKKPNYVINGTHTKAAKINKAIETLELSIELNKKTNLIHKSIIIYKGLSDAYQMKGNYAKALEYYKLHKEANDSVFNETKKGEIVKHELSYLFEKKIQANKLEQIKREAKAQEEKNQLIIILSTTAAFLLLISIITFFLFRTNKIRKITNEQLADKNQQISNQNIELTMLNEQLAEKNQEISQQNIELTSLNEQLAEKNYEISQQNIEFSILNEQLTQNQIEISRQNSELETLLNELEVKNIEIVKSYEELKVLNEKLSEANATKDKFFSIIAHDLKNPISALISGSELLFLYYQRFTDDERIHKIKQLSESSRFLFKMLENLLQWSRSQTGSISFNPKQDDLINPIKSNVELSKITANTKNIEIITEFPDSLICNFDEDMITTVIRNLTSNAVKFTPEGGKIKFGATVKDDEITVMIEDSGLGISEENINKLFKIESTFTTLGTNKEKGTGLGLLLCKEFVDMHNGKIWVESKIGQGSKFYFSLKL